MMVVRNPAEVEKQAQAAKCLIDALMAIEDRESQRFFLEKAYTDIATSGQGALETSADELAARPKEQADQFLRSGIQRSLQICALLGRLAELSGSLKHRALGLLAEANARGLGLGQYEQAIQLYDQAAALYQKNGYAVEHASAQAGKIGALTFLGRYSEALEAGRWASESLEAAREWAALARVTGNLAIVHYPFVLPTLQATAPVTQQVDVSDHGLFVSSLIHALAYQSQIDLYRVLDKSGCGDLYRLNMAMLDFLSSGWGEQGLKQPVVASLSLGVRKPSELPNDPQARAEAEAEIKTMAQETQDAYAVAAADASVESLETVVSLIHMAGIVVVAAAGNDSVLNNPPARNPQLLNMPLPMDLPADYPFVIGVSASNMQDAPAATPIWEIWPRRAGTPKRGSTAAAIRTANRRPPPARSTIRSRGSSRRRVNSA